jgi:hypothetical protein
MSNDEVQNHLDLIQLYMPETNHNVWFGFHYISCVEISRVINEQTLTHTMQTGEKYFSHARQNFFFIAHENSDLLKKTGISLYIELQLIDDFFI